MSTKGTNHMFNLKDTYNWICGSPSSVPQLPVMSFSVHNLPFTEPMLAVWAQLVSLAGSRMEKHRLKKSLSRGLTGTSHYNHIRLVLQLVTGTSHNNHIRLVLQLVTGTSHNNHIRLML